MIMYAVVNLKDKKLILITDNANHAQRTAIGTGNADEYTILSMEDVGFSYGARAEISRIHEEERVKESVCNVLLGRGIGDVASPEVFDKLAADIAADAYNNVIMSKAQAITEAMKAHAEEINSLLTAVND